jgi:thioredoxin reductase
MTKNTAYDVIIIGGSYAGLSAAMALGRSLRQVLIIDSGKPCNRQTPHSHNFLTQDGETPAAIAQKAKAQVLAYDTVTFHEGLATIANKTAEGFVITTQAGESFTAKKLLFATGIADVMPSIKGFAECWGISVLHCPYCHGYEVRNQHIGLLGNGDVGFEFCRLLHQWSKQLTLFTNGPSTLTAAQLEKLQSYNIPIIETELAVLEHTNGQLEQVVLNDGNAVKVAALFARLPFTQHTDMPQSLGCELTEMGHIKVDGFQRTNIPGIYAAGDNASPMRAVSAVVAAGIMAGAMINRELMEEAF